MSRYVKLPEEFLTWQWWESGNHVRLFLWLYIKAKVRDCHVGRHAVRRGSLVTTWQEMQDAVGCSRGTLSRILNDFTSSGVLTLKADCHKTLVTLCKYDTYNPDGNDMWTKSGLKVDQTDETTPINNFSLENKYIYSAHAREILTGNEDKYVTESDCRAWLQRYNGIAARKGYPQCTSITDKRRLYITQRVMENGRGSIDTMFEKLELSDYFFSSGSHGWRGDFTNLFTADVYAKVLEGYYIPLRTKKPLEPQQEQKKSVGIIPLEPQQTEEDRERSADEQRQKMLEDLADMSRREPKNTRALWYQTLLGAYERGELRKRGIDWQPVMTVAITQ